jgi:hypothetical protein
MPGQDRARQPLTPSQKRYIRRGRIISLIAAVIFIASVFAMKPLLDRPARADDLLAMIGGFLMLQLTLVMAVSFMVAPKDAEAPPRRLSYTLTGATCGVALLLPIVGQGWIDPRFNFAIVLALIAGCFWFSWRIWRTSDELHRAYTKESYAATCLVLFSALWIYGTGERLGLFGGVTAWGALAFATLATFVVSIWVAMRRGMTQPPKDE